MNSQAAPRGARIMAWLVVVLVAVLVVLGFAWYGFSAEVHQRIWRDIAERPGGPMSFRFLLQPAMAVIAAIHDGVQDARTGRSPYFWTVLSNPSERAGRLREGLLATARLVLIGLGMDVLYQWRVLDTFYPGEALLVALLLAVLPYLLLRGPVSRIARRFVHPSSGSAR
ncbi:MAG: hypothetical protein ACJ8CF_06555 [Microvirga sp.]